MKLRQVFFTLSFLFMTFQFCLGQKKMEAVLFDELKSIYCTERDTRRIDSFLLEIQNNSNSEGYVIVYADTEFPGEFSKMYKTLQEHISYRRFPIEKIKFIRGRNQNENLFQFWLIPKGATLPTPKSEYREQRITSSTIFDKSWFEIYENSQIAFGGDEETCDRLLDFSGFANFLKKDSGLIGYLIAYSGSDLEKKFANKALKLTLNKILSEYKIPRNRLRIVYGGSRDERKMELWLIPKTEKFSLKSLPKID